MKIEQIPISGTKAMTLYDAIADNNLYIVRFSRKRIKSEDRVVQGNPYGIAFKEVLNTTPEILEQLESGEAALVRVTN